MRNLRQSRLLKAVAVILLFFSLVCIPVSVVGELFLWERVFNNNASEMFGGDFSKSHTFSELFNHRVGQLAEYIELKNILETDGELDYSRVICYMSKDGQPYTLGELIKSSSFFVENIDSQEQVLLDELFSPAHYVWGEGYVFLNDRGVPEIGYSFDSKFIQDFSKDMDWFLVESEDEALELYERRMQNGQQNSGLSSGLTEVTPEYVQQEEDTDISVYRYRVAADDIQVQLAAGLGGMPEGSVQISTLTDLAYRYTYYVAYYLYYGSLFSAAEGQRFVYEVSNGSSIYSNTEEAEAFLSGEKQTDGQLYYSGSGYVMDTDILNVNRTYVDYLEKALTDGSGEFSIFAAVTDWSQDTASDDSFAMAQERFLTAQSLGGMFLALGIAGSFGVLILGFYLLAAAGHARNVEGVRLTGFDKWYTELAGGFCMTVLAGSIGLTVSLIADATMGYYSMSTLAVTGIMLVLSYLLVMFTLASLIRRIKARTLWRNSLLRNGAIWLVQLGRRLSRGCRVVYQERDITARVIIAYLMVLAATVISGILIMVSLISGSVMALFFLLLFAGIHAGTLYVCLKERMDYKRIIEGVERMADGDLNYKIDEFGIQTDNKRLAVAANRIGDGLAEAVDKSIKDERMKTDLITNVSHDIKTPLTSIINYVDLLKREKIENEKIRSYIEVLDSKSQRLKNLTDDLVEASKLSSGNIVLTMQEIDLVELVNQANGEFTEKFAQKRLTIIPALPDKSVIIDADGRRLWRVLENLYNNVWKYAMENTRVYVAVVMGRDGVTFTMKNISENPLNIDADELTERFIRGDVSRSTEGSGLGLSIARSLTELMNGSFEIYLDGDLFRVSVSFPLKEGY